MDFVGNLSFIKSVRPSNIVLVHGEKTNMHKLKQRLDQEIRSHWPGVHYDLPLAAPTATPGHVDTAASAGMHRVRVVTPANGQDVVIQFPKRLKADAVGQAGAAIVQALDGPTTTAGIFVCHHYSDT